MSRQLKRGDDDHNWNLGFVEMNFGEIMAFDQGLR